MKARRSHRRWVFGACAGGLACMALTPGDVGGCGQPVQELDPERFFAAKKHADCERCQECGYETDACRQACDDRAPTRDSFPEGCVPLVHDGEVCLRRLLSASCREVAGYVADVAAVAPTECDFCPLGAR